MLVLAPQRPGWRSAGSGRAVCRRDRRHAAHSRRGLQGQLQQLVDPRHEVDGDNVPQVVAEILIDLLAVAPRQEDTAQPAAVCGQHLLGDAADREHLSAEGDMAVGVSGVGLGARSFAE